jgi:DNA-binding NarL/FixJ family response regulator
MKTLTSPRVRRIVVVDDHPMMRVGLRQYLAQEPDVEVCGEAADAAEALTLLERVSPDLLILDISLEGRSGLDLLMDLRVRFPELPVLVHSMHDQSIYAERALRAGARGYLTKQETGDKLLSAVRQVLRGEIFLSESLRAPRKRVGKGRNGSSTLISTLTEREFEVFRLIGRGLHNQQIAKQLHISLKTVEAHRDHIKRKLHLASSTALNLLAVRWENDPAA